MKAGTFSFEVRDVCWPELWMKFKDIPEIHGNKELLTEWLTIDVRTNEEYLSRIENVLNGSNLEDFICGDAYEAHITKVDSHIHCCFEKELSKEKPCSISTTMLREIVEIWLKEYKRFIEEQETK